MLSTAIVIFREALEIAMILGIVLAATRHLPGRAKWVFGGLLGGLLGAAIVAFFAETISNSVEGMGQELFNAGVLFTAALFIGWTVIWMRTHAREMALHLKHVGHDVASGKAPLYTLSLIVGLALLREGSEIVLFVYGMLLSGQSVASIATGSAAGLAIGTAVGIAMYYGLLKIPAKHALRITSWLLILLVAGLASQGAAFLTAAGYFEHLSDTLWDSSWLLSQEGILGQTLHTLIGYSAEPSEIQGVFYLGTLLLLVVLTLRSNHPSPKAVAA